MAPTTAYVALGANLGDRAHNLRDALRRLGATPGVRVTRVSTFVENPSVGGPPDAPPFLNGAAAVETTLDPHALLTRLLEIERELGRVRGERNDPRTVDLDLILYGDLILDAPHLTLPHPRMHERPFVLGPLAEIAGDAQHPVRRTSIRDMLAAVR